MAKKPDEKKEPAKTKTPKETYVYAELEKLNKDIATVDALCRYAQRPSEEIDGKELSHLFGDFQKIFNAYESEIDFTYNARMYFINEQIGMPRWTNIVNSAKDVLSMLKKRRDRKDHELAIQQGQGEGDDKETSKETNTFRQTGDFWGIVYKRDSLPSIRDLDGFYYIRQILYNPGKRFKALEIYQEVKGNTPIIEVGEYEEGLSISSNLIPSTGQQIMDSSSRKDIERAIEECKGKIEEANAESNIEAKEDLEKKLQELKKYLSSGAGPANKLRKFPDDNERARKTVAKAIGKALEEIKKHNEELYVHLDKSITRGVEVYYHPLEPTIWE